jgi:hypothetical protein
MSGRPEHNPLEPQALDLGLGRAHCPSPWSYTPYSRGRRRLTHGSIGAWACLRAMRSAQWLRLALMALLEEP